MTRHIAARLAALEARISAGGSAQVQEDARQFIEKIDRLAARFKAAGHAIGDNKAT